MGLSKQPYASFFLNAIIHFGEQPSAPDSMLDQSRAVFSQVNNISATLNVLWAMRRYAPDCHIIKLGTMGEYGTPNIDIEATSSWPYDPIRQARVDDSDYALQYEVITTDYERQCSLARALAEEYFDARKVLRRVLERILS